MKTNPCPRFMLKSLLPPLACQAGLFTHMFAANLVSWRKKVVRMRVAIEIYNWSHYSYSYSNK